MSSAAPNDFGDAMARKQTPAQLFLHEARKEGRTVAVLRGVSAESGSILVETEIYPVSAPANSEPQLRPYAFATQEQARRFVDEALLALEYLGCTLTE